jgi:hypothetical protein
MTEIEGKMNCSFIDYLFLIGGLGKADTVRHPEGFPPRGLWLATAFGLQRGLRLSLWDGRVVRPNAALGTLAQLGACADRAV